MKTTLQPLEHYTDACERAASQVIRSYSTSFGLATRLLGKRHRQHIWNIYALVRVADELVDGVTFEADLSPDQQLKALEELESETYQAIRSGYSSNPIVHAFASTARCARIETSLIRPFFASMRMDLMADQSLRMEEVDDAPAVYGYAEKLLEEYVHGSAEVVGLMCLRVFVRDEQVSPETMQVLEHGARSLGAAFQNVNFLRDLADDSTRLHRNYLSAGTVLTDEEHTHYIDLIRGQLADAEATVPLLPKDARLAVTCARQIFSSLTDRLERTPTHVLYERRIRVSTPGKTRVIVQSMVNSWRFRDT